MCVCMGGGGVTIAGNVLPPQKKKKEKMKLLSDLYDSQNLEDRSALLKVIGKLNKATILH